MVAFVNPSTTVLQASSPFLVKPKEKQDAQTSETVLTPAAFNQQAADIAYSFSPAANLALLSRPAASVLLVAQSQNLAPETSSRTASPEKPETSAAASYGSTASKSGNSAKNTLFSVDVTA